MKIIFSVLTLRKVVYRHREPIQQLPSFIISIIDEPTHFMFNHEGETITSVFGHKEQDNKLGNTRSAALGRAQ